MNCYLLCCIMTVDYRVEFVDYRVELYNTESVEFHSSVHLHGPLCLDTLYAHGHLGRKTVQHHHLSLLTIFTFLSP